MVECEEKARINPGLLDRDLTLARQEITLDRLAPADSETLRMLTMDFQENSFSASSGE
jgi:hypothetical protein